MILNGTIAEESWFDDDVTPKLFKDELDAGEGPIIVKINSPGGDCIAASQIYVMLSEYKGVVTVKIDGIAASAASVIAMAGDKVLMSPVSMMMIHNPSTMAFGDHTDMQKAMDMLEGVKNSIINAYVAKTGISRAKLSRLMDDETWMDATKAVELGFADSIIKRTSEDDDKGSTETDIGDEFVAVLFSRHNSELVLQNKLEEHYGKKSFKEPEITELNTGRSADEVRTRLAIMKNFI